MTTEDSLYPTTNLRFVVREVRTEVTPSMATVRMERVLQQWWKRADGTYNGEWRDVPLAEEV